MKNRTLPVIGLFLLVLVLITACQPPPLGEISVSDLHGVWRQLVADKPWGYFLFLNEDGSFAMTGSSTQDDPYDFGKYLLEGSAITFESDSKSPNCPSYRAWAAVEFNEDGNLQFQIMDQECPTPQWQDPIVVYVRYETD